MRTTERKTQVMVIWFALLTVLGWAASSRAAEDVFIWQFQHSQPGIQEARASTVDAHGNLIITGYTDTSGNDSDADFYTIKISSNGQTVLWAARYTNPLGDDWAKAVAVDSNDDVIITGFRSNGINTDIAVIKYDGATGAQKWAAPYIFNGAANGNDEPMALAIDALNNIYVAGYSQNGGATADDGLLFKLTPAGANPDGTPIWQVNFNGAASGEDRFNSVSVGVDGIVVAGHTTVMHSGSRLDFDYLTIKFDYSGAMLWQKTYDNGTEDDLAYAAGLDQGGNVIVTGEVLSGSRHDMRTIKYAANDGHELWTRTYSGGSPNIPRGLVVDSDGEVYLTGNTFTISGKDDYYTARYAGANGAVVWEQVFNSGGDNVDVPQALAVDHTGGLYVTGYTHKATTNDDDFQTLKYNKANGNQIWQQAQDGPPPPQGSNEQPVGVAVALAVTADGNIYVGGWSERVIDNVDDLDYFAVKYNADLLNSPTGLTATVTSPTRIDLAWQDNSADPNNEDNFCVERCQGFACNDFTEITCAVARNQTVYTDNAVSRDSWYSYRITAKNAAKGYSLPTAPTSALTTVINYPAPAWLYTHDGEGLDDMANAIAMASDNNPVATGMSATALSQYDYYTVKLDRNNAATPYWIGDYDGDDGQGDMGVCLTVDPNDDVIVSGFSSRNTGQGGGNTNDIFTIKYAATGPDPYTGFPMWTAPYNGPGNDDDRSTAVASAADGSGYTAVTGWGKNTAGNDDIYLIKYKPEYDGSNEQQLWAITPFDRGFNDYPVTTAFTPDGDIVVVGSSERATDDSDIFIGLYNRDTGAVMPGWPYVRDLGHGIDGINAVAIAPDKSIYVAGYTKNAAGNLDIYINKFSYLGVSQWGSGIIIDGDGHGYDEAKSIAIDPNDGEVVVAAAVTSASGSQDLHILRYTANGTLRWRKTLDLIEHDERLTAMAMSPSGEICLAGETDNNIDTDVIAVKYDHLGNLIGSTKFDSGFDDYATAITVNRLGEFYIAGYSATGELASDDYDFVVFRFNGQELQAPSPFAVTPHNTTAELSWTENDENVSGYKAYRKTGSCSVGGTSFSPGNLIRTMAQGDTGFTDSGLNIGSTYCYGVQTYRLATSEVSRIIERQVTTSTPVPPSNVTATIKNTSEVELCWHDNSASEDGFAIQRCTGANCDFSQVTTLFAPAETNPSATSTCLVDTSACNSGGGKSFRYRVQSYKVNAWSSGFAEQTDTLTLPGLMAPSSLNATRVAEAKVDLQWTDNTVDESDFMIERCQGSGCSNFAEIGAISAIKGNVLLLEMDETAWNGTPGQVIDYSGKGRSATAFGGATTADDAHAGRSGSLNGSYQYLTAPLTIDQSAQSAGVTMMAWVKPSSASGGQHYLFSTEDGTASVRNNWGLLREGGTWSVATGEAVRSTGVAANSGEWQHVAVVFAPGTGVRFYKNGTEVFINYLASHSTSANFTIGRQGVLNQNFFDGLTDEVAVYDRALTAAKVQKLFTRGIFPETTGKKWYTDTTVSANLDYRYRITARKLTDCGTDLSAPSNIIPVTTTPLAPQPVTATLIKPGVVNLAWTPQTTTQTGFQMERCNGAGCTNFTVLSSSIGASATRFTDNTACYGGDGVIRYQVRAVGAWGQSPPSAVAQVASTPGTAPSGLSVDRTTEGSVSLKWTHTDANRDGFTVERCQGTQAECAQSHAFNPISGSPVSGQDAALQGLWRMEELAWNGTANEVADSSGKNHPGTAGNGAAVESPGVNGSFGAASFDGVDDAINTNLVLDQSKTSPGATFMAWVYPTEYSWRYKYLFSTNNGGTDWGLSLYGPYWYVDTGYSTYWGAYAPMNTWQHVAVVFDPNAGVSVYINGAAQNTVPYMDYDSSSGPVILGRDPVFSGTNFAGKLDEAAVFSRVLSPQEIAQYYNRTNPIPLTDNTGISTGSTYTYRVTPVVNTTCGDWGPSATPAQVTTTTPATPVAPDTLQIIQRSSTELDLSWRANTATESWFEIERCQGVSCDFSTHDTFLAGPGVTAYNDTSVCQGQTYRYRVRAVQGAAAPWTWQTDFSPTAIKATATASAVTVGLNVVSESEIGVSWNDTNQDETSYELARCQVEPGVTACDQPAQFSLIDTFPGTVTGAQLHYRMDEGVWNGTSNEVIDASGNGRHGTAYSATTVAEGRFGRAGTFNGSASYVSTPLTLNQARNSAGVTMEAWVYPTMSDGNPRSVLSTDNAGVSTWGIVVKNGTWHVSTGLSVKDTGIAADLNTWQHVTAVFTPLSGIKFYKNGTVVTISEIEPNLISNPLTIGRNAYSSWASQYYFQGKIDEVLVYARALNDSEIAAHNTYQERTLYSYSDTSVQHSKTYYYRVTARKTASCGWAKEASASASTPAPPAPTNLTVNSSSSTHAALSWQDNNGSELRYVVSRCEGTSGNCPSPVLTQLPPNSKDFTDSTLCAGTAYTFRVWAEGAWGLTGFAEQLVTTASQPAAPSNLSATRTSEVEIGVAWNFTPADETHVQLERCQGANCVTIDLPPGTTSYDDNELLPRTQYCYRVSAYKTAGCGWTTAATDQVCATTSLDPGALTATPADTTTVDLAWTDATQTETASIAERCQGDLMTCCNGNPASCAGTFTPVGTVGFNQHDFSDTSACAGQAYTYRVNTKGDGLRQANGGCWTKRAPLTFTSFPAFAGVEVVVPFQSGMRADFADLRFYDATAHRELQYWIKQKTNSSSATIWLMTGANQAIYLYYGNQSASSVSASDAMFTEVYDEFPGGTIDPAKWVTIDPPSDKISQNNGLQFAFRNESQDAAVFSAKTFERAAGNELFIDFTVGADISATRNESFFLGWGHNQLTSPSWSGNATHLLYLTSSSNHYFQCVYEYNSASCFTKTLYNDRTRYQLKIVLNAGAGAKYYFRGGTIADWRLLTETTNNWPDDDAMRIAFFQASHTITVHQVTVKHVSAQRGTSVNFAAAEGNGVACLPLSHTWDGVTSLAAQAQLDPVMAPDSLTATATGGAVVLEWNPGTGDESEFRVERNCGSGFSQIGTAPGSESSYRDTTMPNSTACTYRVKGHKESACPWTSAPSNTAQTVAPPAGPTVSATALNAFQIRLTWNDDADEEAYDIEAQIFNGAWVPVATVPANQVAYTDSHGVNPGTQYKYRVRARRATSTSGWSQASATTPAYSPGAATCPLP